MAKKVLGKGLSAIISSSPTPVEDLEKGIARNADVIAELDVESILPNPDQPRTSFDELGIKGLAASIQAVGLLQPIIVRRADDNFYVVAGERRLRAAKQAGLKKIKSIVIEADEVKNLTLALIENIQRTDLNPIEEGEAYKVLINRFNLRQQDIASQVGKDRATIANTLRLLQLPAEIQEALTAGEISTGHAKVLLSVGGIRQMELFRQILKKSMSVRALEQIVDEVEQALQESPDREIPTQKVGAHVMKRLKELDQVAYVRFASVYRQFEDVHEFMSELKDLLDQRK